MRQLAQTWILDAAAGRRLQAGFRIPVVKKFSGSIPEVIRSKTAVDQLSPHFGQYAVPKGESGEHCAFRSH